MTRALFTGGIPLPPALCLLLLVGLAVASLVRAGNASDDHSAPAAAPNADHPVTPDGALPKADPSTALERRETIDEARTSPLYDGEFKGNVTLSPNPMPYGIQGTIKLPDETTITVPGGVEVRGGTFDLGTKGHIIVTGDKGKPAIFRHVTFLQDLGALLKADNAVFEDCKFGKGGVWYNVYSSKWTFTSCVLHGCHFPKLTEVDYGFQLQNCALISMDFPEIKHPHKPGFSHPALLRSEWNKITGCTFVDCTLPPTVCWCAEKSNFAGCKFIPGEAFESDQPWKDTAYVTNTLGQAPEEAWAANAPKNAAIHLIKVETPFPSLSLAGFDSLIPELVVGDGGEASVRNSRLK